MNKNEQCSNNIAHRSNGGEKRIICLKQWNIDCFFKLIDEELEDFFEHDQCSKLADKYLVAMVFVYFLRAVLRPEEYTRFNFFVALYLAHDMEEDEDDTRVEIRIWANSSNLRNLSPLSFLEYRDDLWRRMEHRGAVSRVCCDEVMCTSRPFHKIWLRQRHVNHSGASRGYYRRHDTCPNCLNSHSQSSTASSEYSPELVHIIKLKRSASNARMDKGTGKKLKTNLCEAIQYRVT